MFYKLEDSTKPEIKRCNLSNVILQLKALGVDDVVEFDFLEKPPRCKFLRAYCLSTLFDLSFHVGLHDVFFIIFLSLVNLVHDVSISSYS